MNSLHLYKTVLLPNLQNRTTHLQRCKIDSFKKSKTNLCRPLEYISPQEYVHKDLELELNGYKIVRNVFKNHDELDMIHAISDLYNLNMCEFADKHDVMKTFVVPMLKNEDFIHEYKKVFGGPFLWQKSTIHRKCIKHCTNNDVFDKNLITAEHMDITETPNSHLTITAYIAITDQYMENTSKLLIYPESHLQSVRIPQENFDYVSIKSNRYHQYQSLFCEINQIVELYPELEIIRECLYHLIVLDTPEYKILNSTFLLMIFNHEIFKMKYEAMYLKKGDVVFFLSNVLHGSTPHKNKYKSRVSLAVRGGIPYYENSSLISESVPEHFYKNKSLKKDTFLFSGTQNMIDEIHSKNEFKDIIYKL
jgi:hypothetical protein